MKPKFTRSEYKSAVLHIASVVKITNSYGPKIEGGQEQDFVAKIGQ